MMLDPAGKSKEKNLRRYSRDKVALEDTTLEKESLLTVKLSNEHSMAELEVTEAAASAKVATLKKTGPFRDFVYEHAKKIFATLFLLIFVLAVLFIVRDFAGNPAGLHYTVFTIFMIAVLCGFIYFMLNRMFPQDPKTSPIVMHGMQQSAEIVKKAVERAQSKADQGDGPSEDQQNPTR